MKNFILGMVAYALFYKNRSVILKVLENLVAKLELKADMIQHDNPDLS